MAIRLSGLSSGMDTEALVEALVSSYSLKKDNLVKAQTKLSWKQDKWKTMNTSIYSFYSGKLSAARLSKAYNLKAATVSNSAYAKVTASAAAVNGTQSLKITGLAATGYLTGGEITGTDADGKKTELTGSSKLSEVTGLDGMGSGSISVSVDGKEKSIDITPDMTLDQFTAKLKEAGLNASFDAANQRFFVSSKTSGASHDFRLTADNAAGLSALQSLGLYTANDADKAEYEKWAKLNSDSAAMAEAVESAYENAKLNYSDRAKMYADNYNAAKKSMDEMLKESTFKNRYDIEANIKSRQEMLDKMTFADSTARTTDEKGNVKYDTSKMTEDELKTYNSFTSQIKSSENMLADYDKYAKAMADSAAYVNIDSTTGAATAATDADADKTAYNALTARVDADNADIKSKIETQYANKAAYSEQMLADINSGKLADSAGAVRIKGEDSRIELNGAVFTNNTNNFSINGLTIQATALTGTEAVSITTSTDTDAIYNSIKDFLKEYNTLIKSMDEAYNASSSKGYEPLTSKEKEAMTDDEVEQWEKKIKDSLLRKDSTLGNTATALKNDMQKIFTIDGKDYSLSSFGISTLGYFTSGDNEKGVLHIDGDKDDASTSGNTDKLRAMIASDPETVVSFFSQLASNMYNDLGNRMASSSVSSAYTIYNDKEMATEYSEYTTKISDQEDKVTTWEDYYYKKFSAMETALSKLNSQTSSLSNLFG
ncbi:MAG: flagellar filament capping protein FliD [Eubacteriales bacterium]|nr:flagellar filament capping protein FliD [Eubacteriales bacterium]